MLISGWCLFEVLHVFSVSDGLAALNFPKVWMRVHGALWRTGVPSRMNPCLMLSVPRVGSCSSGNLTRIKYLLKMKEWISKWMNEICYSTSPTDPECSSTTWFQSFEVPPLHPIAMLPSLVSFNCITSDLNHLWMPAKQKSDQHSATFKHLSHPRLHRASSNPLEVLDWFHHLSEHKEGMHEDSSLVWHLGGKINFPQSHGQSSNTL